MLLGCAHLRFLLAPVVARVLLSLTSNRLSVMALLPAETSGGKNRNAPPAPAGQSHIDADIVIGTDADDNVDITSAVAGNTRISFLPGGAALT